MIPAISPVMHTAAYFFSAGNIGGSYLSADENRSLSSCEVFVGRVLCDYASPLGRCPGTDSPSSLRCSGSGSCVEGDAAPRPRGGFTQVHRVYSPTLHWSFHEARSAQCIDRVRAHTRFCLWFRHLSVSSYPARLGPWVDQGEVFRRSGISLPAGLVVSQMGTAKAVQRKDRSAGSSSSYGMADSLLNGKPW